jgi:hypothetical protein
LVFALLLFSEISAMENGHYQPFNLKAQAMAYVFKHACELSTDPTEKLKQQFQTLDVKSNVAHAKNITLEDLQRLSSLNNDIRTELTIFLEPWKNLAKYSAIQDVFVEKAHDDSFVKQVLICLAKKEPFENDLHRQLRLLPHPPYSTQATELVHFTKTISSPEQLEKTELADAQKKAIKALLDLQKFGEPSFPPIPEGTLFTVLEDPTLLEAALCLKEHNKYAQYLLEEGLLLSSVMYHAPIALNFFLSRNISPNSHKGYKESCHNTLLTCAAFTSTPAVLQVLLDHGADINLADGEHTTPIMAAVGGNMCSNIKLLLENGADAFKLTNKRGFSAYSLMQYYIKHNSINVDQQTIQLLENYRKREYPDEYQNDI